MFLSTSTPTLHLSQPQFGGVHLRSSTPTIVFSFSSSSFSCFWASSQDSTSYDILSIRFVAIKALPAKIIPFLVFHKYHNPRYHVPDPFTYRLVLHRHHKIVDIREVRDFVIPIHRMRDIRQSPNLSSYGAYQWTYFILTTFSLLPSISPPDFLLRCLHLCFKSLHYSSLWLWSKIQNYSL